MDFCAVQSWRLHGLKIRRRAGYSRAQCPDIHAVQRKRTGLIAYSFGYSVITGVMGLRDSLFLVRFALELHHDLCVGELQMVSFISLQSWGS